MITLATITWDATTIALVASAAGGIITALTTSIVAIINAAKGKATNDAMQQTINRVSTRQNAADDRVAQVATAVPSTTPVVIVPPLPQPTPPTGSDSIGGSVRT